MQSPGDVHTCELQLLLLIQSLIIFILVLELRVEVALKNKIEGCIISYISVVVGEHVNVSV